MVLITTKWIVAAFASTLALSSGLHANAPLLNRNLTHTNLTESSETQYRVLHSIPDPNGSIPFVQDIDEKIHQSAATWWGGGAEDAPWWTKASWWINGSRVGSFIDANPWIGMWGGKTNDEKNGSIHEWLRKNHSLVRDAFSATCMHADKVCSGVPFGVVYSNLNLPFQDDRCQSNDGPDGISIQNHFDVKDVFADAKQRFGGNVSFVMRGVGEDCRVGTPFMDRNVTLWVAFQADNQCHPSQGLGDFHFHDQEQEQEQEQNQHQDQDQDQDQDDHHETLQHQHQHHNQTNSVRVGLKDNTLHFTTYYDRDCLHQHKSTTIDDTAKPVGDSLFCQDDGLYQVFDASGQSSLFTTTVSDSNSKSKSKSKSIRKAGDSRTTSPAVSMSSVSLLVSTISVVGAIVLHL